jgi:hypothetical protein
MFKENEEVILIHTGEVGKVLMVDDINKQAEVEFPDESCFVYSYNQLKKVSQ